MPERCICCPRYCHIDRQASAGFCGAGSLPRVARAALHHWEEPMISGENGSGTVFFSGCNLRCSFCQNADISREQRGSACTAAQLADIFLGLENEGAHNINLVTPTPHIDTIAKAIPLARQKGLSIPFVYNTGGYESPEGLQRLRGLIAIYMPDLKYYSLERSRLYANAGDYFARASAAILAMYGQVGGLKLDQNGIAQQGLLIRHLILPGNLEESRHILAYIRDHFPEDIYISLMCQYTPRVGFAPPLDRRLTQREYERMIEYGYTLGFKNMLLQESGAADERYIPLFYDTL